MDDRAEVARVGLSWTTIEASEERDQVLYRHATVGALLREIARLRDVETAYDRLHADIKAGVVYLLPAERVAELRRRR